MTTTTTTQPQYWSGNPETCDICHKSLDETFIDGATTIGPWAIMCKHCFNIFGRGLGLGKGQRYEKQPDNLWLKTNTQ
jgi:hypothetical protein